MQGRLDREGVVVLVREGQGDVQFVPRGYVKACAERVGVEGGRLARVVQLEGERGRGVVRGQGGRAQRPQRCAGKAVRTCAVPRPRRRIGGAAEPGETQGDAAADCLRAIEHRAGGKPQDVGIAGGTP